MAIRTRLNIEPKSATVTGPKNPLTFTMRESGEQTEAEVDKAIVTLCRIALRAYRRDHDEPSKQLGVL